MRKVPEISDNSIFVLRYMQLWSGQRDHASIRVLRPREKAGDNRAILRVRSLRLVDRTCAPLYNGELIKLGLISEQSLTTAAIPSANMELSPFPNTSCQLSYLFYLINWRYLCGKCLKPVKIQYLHPVVDRDMSVKRWGSMVDRNERRTQIKLNLKPVWS